jgi:NCAIR mutase (PurE)-related protein
MERQALIELLNALHKNDISVESALEKLQDIPFSDMDFAKVDHHRPLRVGFPEVIFCQAKTPDQVADIVANQIAHDETIFGTRASEKIVKAVSEKFGDIEHNATAQCFWRKSSKWKNSENAKGTIIIASAGTSDAGVVEEARCTVEILGHACEAIHDVGVAGIHRLFAHREQLQHASVIIVVAGMEGALPSVISGLVSCPVIGVPTSVGYGSHLGGLVPLFAMLNSCASGMTVVNIDNGFGAACAAVKMNRKAGGERKRKARGRRPEAGGNKDISTT